MNTKQAETLEKYLTQDLWTSVYFFGIFISFHSLVLQTKSNRKLVAV